MTKKDTAILVVSFGTSYNENRKVTIDAIEEAVGTAFSDYPVRRAFTSQMIINKLRKRDGMEIDNEAESLVRAAADGIKKLIVQPTHLMNGTEYHDLKRDVDAHAHLFEQVVLGEPLLTDDDDFTKTAEAMVSDTKALTGEKTAVVLMGHGTGVSANRVYYDLQDKLSELGYNNYFIATVEATPTLEEKTAVVLMGHGTGVSANRVYYDLQDKLSELGYNNYFIATVEATPTLEDILPKLKEGGYEKIVLQPLMIVAGDHANNDMASDEDDSWKTILEKEGYRVECVLRGMGQIPAVRDIFTEHVKAAFEKLNG